MEILINEASKHTLKQLALKFMERSIEKRISKECNKIFPLQNVYITKMKTIKQPKFDIAKLMELYSEKPEKEAPKQENAEEAANLLEAKN